MVPGGCILDVQHSRSLHIVELLLLCKQMLRHRQHLLITALRVSRSHVDCWRWHADAASPATVTKQDWQSSEASGEA